jgi:hypothetical protein
MSVQTVTSKPAEHGRHSVFHIQHFISKDVFSDRWKVCDETDFIEDVINISIQVGQKDYRDRHTVINYASYF